MKGSTVMCMESLRLRMVLGAGRSLQSLEQSSAELCLHKLPNIPGNLTKY